MPLGEMLTVFCYDVSDDRRRHRIASLLEDSSTRVQYSVFESRMSQNRADALARRLASMLGKGDSLRVYAVGRNGERRSVVYGDAVPIERDEGYWLF